MISPLCWSSSVRIHSVSVEVCVHSKRCTWLKALTDCPCRRGSCHTLWPGGPTLGMAQAWCVWSRARTPPARRPCSGAWTSLGWRFWSTGGTGWCPGPAPSNLAEPHPSQDLRRVEGMKDDLFNICKQAMKFSFSYIYVHKGTEHAVRQHNILCTGATINHSTESKASLMLIVLPNRHQTS